MAEFTWENRSEFVKELLAAEGSSNVTAEVVRGKNMHLGRYARQYSSSADDEPGRAVAFYCIARLPAEYNCLILTDVPWSSQADYDQVYALLISAGAIPNDLTDPEKERALAARQK